MIAYLLLVHANPKHLGRLIARLRSDNVVFFVHVDKKSDIEQFIHLEAQDVKFVATPVAVYWGDFSQVEAILSLMQAALLVGSFERLVLLSGADYPLCSTAGINSFFARHPKDEFINLVEMPSHAAGKPLARLINYKVREGLPIAQDILLRLLLKSRLISRKRDYKIIFGDLSPYGGSTWWALTGPACEYVMDFVRREPEIVDFFKCTEYPDESFIHTILGNSPFKQSVTRNLTYTDWSAGGGSPANISDAHLAYFRDTPKFGVNDVYGVGPSIFARKFSDNDQALLEKLDAQIADGGQSDRRLD